MLALDEFRRVIAYHPYHFWQLAGSAVPVTSKCNSLVHEYSWQDAEAAGRDNVREAIALSHQRLAEHLGYWVGPHYVETVVPYPRLADPRMQRFVDVDARARRVALQLPEGRIDSFGVETFLSIDPAAAVVLSDSYGDGVIDTFTLTVNLAGVDAEADEIAVYFASCDRLDGDPIGERWEIAPINVSITGVTATITGRSWLIVEPVLYQGVNSAPLDPADVSIYVSELAVVKHYANPDGTTIDNAQAVLIWETDPAQCAIPCCGLEFASGYSDPHAEGYALARVGIRDAERGWVHPGESILNADGTWSEIDWSGCKPPDRALLRYKAGAAWSTAWRQTVARLAAAELSRAICACDAANQELYRWQFDLSRAAGANDEQYQISPADLANPLGTRAGQVFAWKRIESQRLTRAYIA